MMMVRKPISPLDGEIGSPRMVLTRMPLSPLEGEIGSLRLVLMRMAGSPLSGQVGACRMVCCPCQGIRGLRRGLICLFHNVSSLLVFYIRLSRSIV